MVEQAAAVNTKECLYFALPSPMVPWNGRCTPGLTLKWCKTLCQLHGVLSIALQWRLSTSMLDMGYTMPMRDRICQAWVISGNCDDWGGPRWPYDHCSLFSEWFEVVIKRQLSWAFSWGSWSFSLFRQWDFTVWGFMSFYKWILQCISTLALDWMQHGVGLFSEP